MSANKILVEILGEAKNFNAAADDAGKHGEHMGAKMVAAGALVTGVGAELEHLSGPIEQSRKQLEAGFAAAGVNFEDYKGKVESAEGKMRDFGHSMSDTDNALNTMTIAFGDPQKALDNMQLVADIAAKKHISLADAAGIVAKAHGGSAKVFKEFGIQVKTNADGTKDYEGALGLLGDKVKGQASAAVDTFGGKVDIIKTKIGDWVGQIGSKLVPVLAIAGPAIAGIGAVIESGVIPPLVEAAIAALPWIAACAAVAAAAYLIVDNWDTIVDFFTKLPGRILDFLKDLPDLLLDLGKKLLQGLLDGVEWLATTGLKLYFVGLPLLIIGWMGDVAGWLLDVGKKVLGGLLDGIKWLATTGLYDYFIGIPLQILQWIGSAELWLLDKGKDILVGMLKGIGNGLSDITDFFFQLPNKVLGWLGDGGSILLGWGKALITGIWSGIKAGWNWLAGGWNNSIGKWSFHIPDWVPLIGGKGFDMPDAPILKGFGGPVEAGMPYIVGDRGPELFTPGTSGSITPSGKFGGDGTVYNLVVNAGLGTDGPRVGQAIIEFIQQNERRNGAAWRGA